jgi:hypothetical protein
MNHTPHPAIIILFPTMLGVDNPSAGTGWLRKLKPIPPPPKKSRIPNRPTQPIPSFDRKELRERVNRLLRQNQQQRDQLMAAASEHLFRSYCAA